MNDTNISTTMSNSPTTVTSALPSALSDINGIVPDNDPSILDITLGDNVSGTDGGLADTARAQTDIGGAVSTNAAILDNNDGTIEEDIPVAVEEEVPGRRWSGHTNQDNEPDWRYLAYSFDKGTDVMHYYSTGEKIKFTEDEMAILDTNSINMILLLRVDDPVHNSEADVVAMNSLRQKYVEAARIHNEMVCGITDGAYYDSGFDLFVPEDVHFKGNAPGEFKAQKINHRVRCAAYTDSYSSTGFPVFPRSSISKTPLRLANNVGIIDSGYRGNLLGAFDYFGLPYMPHKRSSDTHPIGGYTVKKDSRLLQICAANLGPFIVKVVDQLDDSTRGAGGFGSTGV